MSSSARSNVRFFSTCFFCRSNRKSLLASRVGPGAHILVLTSHLAHWAHLRSSQSCGEPWDWLRQCSWQYQVLYQVVISESSARDCRVDCLLSPSSLGFQPSSELSWLSVWCLLFSQQVRLDSSGQLWTAGRLWQSHQLIVLLSSFCFATPAVLDPSCAAALIRVSGSSRKWQQKYHNQNVVAVTLKLILCFV